MPRTTTALRLAAAAAVLLSAPPPFAAQERVIPLDTLRVDASSLAAGELGAATRAVDVIPAEAIRRSPASSVADLLQWSVGVDLMPRSPALTDVALRGSSFEQVLVLVDGIRVSDAQTGHFDLDLAVPLDQVERIEILRGPASSLHGADAVGGVINVVTRRDAPGPAARAEAGSFGTIGLALSHGAAIGAARVDVAGELRRADGHRPGTDYETGTARMALRAPVLGGPLRADAAIAARDFGAEGFYGDYPSYEETRTATASLAWRADAGPRLSLEPLLSLRRHGDDFVLFREDPARYRNRHTTMQWGGELLGRFAAAPGLRLAAGVEAYRDELESASLGDRAEDRAAALAEVAAGRIGAVTATAGLRADLHERYGTVWSPSLAAAWWPAERLRLRASGGRAFRAPTWTERYYRDPANVGDPDLSPERAWSAEAGFELLLPFGLRLGAAGFLRDAEELIDWARPSNEPDAPWRTRNVESARFRGLEAELAAEEVLGIRWTGHGSWLSLESSAAAGFDSKYALRPVVETLALSADRAFAGGLALSLRATRTRRAEEAAYLRADARASYSLHGARVFADAQNLFDADYLDILGYPAAGRSLLLGAEWRK